MDLEGYPEKFELDKIKNWDIKDVFSLIKYLKSLWTYDDAFIENWSKDDLSKLPIFYLELHTYGWSGNEDLIKALLQNELFECMWYAKWKRGGHYYFNITPYGIGYETVKEIAKRKGVSKQNIHHNKDNYDWIVIGKKTMLCREKTEQKAEARKV